MQWTAEEKRVQVFLADGVLELSFPGNGGVRLRYGAHGPEEAWCPVLEKEPELLDCQVQEDGASLEVRADNIAFRLDDDGAMQVSENDAVRWRAPAGALRAEQQGARLYFCSPPEDAVYGLGQDPEAKLDHNHQERRMWNQWGGHERSGNCGIGFFMSTGGYGMLLATPAAARFGFNENAPQPLDPLGEAMVPSPWGTAQPLPAGMASVEAAGALDLFLFFGPLPALLRQYYGLTGLPRLLPKWAYGFLQCKNRYMNQADLLETARRLRAEGLPCDGLIIDWLWFSEFGDLEWRTDDWPDAAGMLAELARMGFHVSSAQHPFISAEGKYYQDYCAQGYLNEVPSSKRITYDHTNPAARAHWWEKTAALYRQGLRGYWTDMGELEEHFEGTKSAAGSRLKTHNAYSLLWAQGLYEGQQRDFGTRPFILARSGCAGIQKYGTALWSGDVNATWQVLQDQVVLGQGMALSGIPWWCTDIGGFLSGDECTPELYVRWMEWGVFCGVFRTHGTRPGNEAWSFGPEAAEQIHTLVRLRYTLLPYIYSLALACALEGAPLVRPVAYACPGDAQAARCTGEYFFGPSLLVAPVTRHGARTARVYLPQGEWYHWWSGQKYGQGWHTVPAPLGQPPLFGRAGALVPIYRALGRNTADCGGLCLLAFPGGDGAFDYYDDDGVSFGYEAGAYTHVRFSQRQGTVQAQALQGEVPAYEVEFFAAPQSREPFTLDCAWQNDRAEITLTFLQDAAVQGELEPDEGWCVVDCTAGGCAKEIQEHIYRPHWEGPLCAKAGDTVRWKLLHTDTLRRVGVQCARLTLQGHQGEQHCLEARWDGPFLSAPQMLGCLPAGALSAGFAPQEAPDEPAYRYQGQRWCWRRDPLFAHNSYGYVDFRRLGPTLCGEAMSGEAWAKEILYSKIGQKVEFDLRYDSPVTLWLNGEKVLCGQEKNAPRVRICLQLKAGRNVLVVHQAADIARPYSGGEFGYSLCLVGTLKIYTLK